MSEQYSSGTTPLPTDTQRVLEVKILTKLNSGSLGGTTNVSGHGSPVGVVTPTQVNAFYRDVDTNTLWQSTGLTASDWIQWI